MSTSGDVGEVGAVGLAGGGIGEARDWSSRRTSPACSTTRRTAGRCRSPCRVRPARPTSPSAPFCAGVAPGHVLARGVAVGQQHGVAAIRRQRAVGLVGERDLGHHGAVFEPEVLGREGAPSATFRGSPCGAGGAGQHEATGRAASSGRRPNEWDMRSSSGQVLRSGPSDQARAGCSGGRATACAASRLRSSFGPDERAGR